MQFKTRDSIFIYFGEKLARISLPPLCPPVIINQVHLLTLSRVDSSGALLNKILFDLGLAFASIF